MLNKFTATALICLLLFSCKKSDVGTTPAITAKTMLNVAYGADPLQTMDIYLPAGRSTTTTRVIVMIHGGGWNGGDKADMTQFVDSFHNRLPDFAVINLNYRLALNSSTLFPTQELDVKAAMQFIVNHTAEYLVSQKWVLVGASAGAHLALLQGNKYATPLRPKAIVSLFGISDMADMYNNPTSPLIPPGILQVIGKTPSQDPLIYANSSPVNFVTSASPPTILLHGGVDPLVKASQSVTMKNLLQAAGVINQYVFYPTEGHGWVGANLVDSFNKIQAFILANVN